MSNNKTDKTMNTLNTTKLIEATIAAGAIIGGAAVIIPAIGILAAAGLAVGNYYQMIFAISKLGFGLLLQLGIGILDGRS